jgi:hypothetical protein
MTAQTLLDDLAAAGVRLTAQAGRLHVDAPVGALTDADRIALRTQKAELLALLAPPDTALLADVVALAEARGWPRLTAGGHGISGRDAWFSVMRDLPDGELRIVRAALLRAQRRDGPHPTAAIDLDEVMP